MKIEIHIGVAGNFFLWRIELHFTKFVLIK